VAVPRQSVGEGHKICYTSRLCNKLADTGKRVIVAGLDQDFRGNPQG